MESHLGGFIRDATRVFARHRGNFSMFRSHFSNLRITDVDQLRLDLLWSFLLFR